MPGPTWILLRGLTRESGHWGDFLDRFSSAFAGDTVLALDLPGNGALWQQPSPTQVAGMVQACREQLAQRGIAPPYRVLAMSLGAMVAVAWAHAQPQELRALVLINTSLRPYSAFYRRLRPVNYADLLRLGLGGCRDEARERLILRLTSNRDRTEVLPDWLALRARHRVSARNALAQLWAAARYRAPAAAPTLPTLLLASAGDRLVDAECSRLLAQRWGCELRLHPDAGHDLPLDDGPWVLAQVQDWLARQPAQRQD